jgi:competence protein ComEC
MGGRSAVAAAVGVWLGILWGTTAGVFWVTALVAVSLGFGWLALRAPSRVGTLALLIALTLAGAARGGAHQRAIDVRRATLPDRDRPIWIEGRLVEPPPRESGEPAAVVSVTAARPPIVRGSRVRLRFPAGSDVEWGDEVRALARIEAPDTCRNPGGYDARAAADAGGIVASGRALVVERRASSILHRWPRATATRWRRAIERRLDAGLSPGARELVVPLVIGDRSALPTDLNARLRASGLIHLLALSGLHVVWLASLARGGCAALGGGPRARALAGALCAATYAGIAGPLPSLLRAAVTETLVALARGAGRALDPMQSLATGALLLLAVAPGWARDVGFQLSCAATLGLVAIGPWLLDRAGRARGWVAAFVPTVSAQVTALPILLASFHAVSWVGALANLAAVPVCGLLLTAAWLAAVLELLVPGAGARVFGACEVLALALRTIVTTASAAPAALVSAGGERGVAVVAGVGAALLVTTLLPTRSLAARSRRASIIRTAAGWLGAFALLLALVLVATARPLRPPPGRAWVVFLDVGQGDAIALGFHEGWWLVDAGPHTPHFDAGESIVAPFFRWAGVRRLEAMVLTHDDGDHTGGAMAVERALRVSRVLAAPAFAGVPGPGARFHASTVARGDTLHRGPAVIVLWPPRPGSPSGADSAWSPSMSLTSPDNAAGIVLEIGTGAARMVLLADVDSLVEQRLSIAPGVAVLKLGHHGSASSSGAAFLLAVRPRTAVISVGVRNRFGHPAPAVLERVRASRATLARTDLAGALWFELGPRGVEPVDWRHDEPGPVRSRAGGPVTLPPRARDW